MKVLEEFWYGNINPMEIPFQSQRKFDNVLRLLTKKEEELLKNLNEQEKELINKVKACYDEMIQITECQTFIKGFKLGARFFIECFENDAYEKRRQIESADHEKLKTIFKTIDEMPEEIDRLADDYIRMLFDRIEIVSKNEMRICSGDYVYTVNM